MPIDLGPRKSSNTDLGSRSSGPIDLGSRDAPKDLSTVVEKSDQATTIPGSRQYQNADHWLGRAMEAVDYLGNASKSGLSAAIKGDNVIDAVKEAGTKDRATTATNLKDDLSREVNGGTFRFGKDDGEFQFGDVADIYTDFMIDVATDPLTYVSSGASGAAKLLGLGGKAAKGLKALNVLDKVVAPAGMGAIYGAGSAEKGADAADMLERAAIGAGTGVALRNAGKVLKPALYGDDLAKGIIPTKMTKGEWAKTVGKRAFGKEDDKVLNGLFDQMSDYFAKKSEKGGAGLGRAARITDGAMQKLAKKAALMFSKRENALQDLDDLERVELDGILKELKNGTAEFRNKRFKELSINPRELLDDSPMKMKSFNEVTREANEHAEKVLFPKIMAEKSEKMYKAVDDMAKINDDLIKEYNQFKFGIDEAGDDGIGLVGIKYHTDDLKYFNPKDDFNALDDFFSKTKTSGADIKEFKNADSDTWKSVRDAGVGPDQRYAEYSRKFSQNFLDDKEKEATQMFFDYLNKSAGTTGTASLEGLGKLTDAMNNWFKSGVLMASTAWYKNNYFDNLMKAYVENGLGTALRTAREGNPLAPTKDFRKMFSIFRGNVKGNLPKGKMDQMMMDAIEDGALDGPSMTGMIGDFTKEALTKEKIAQGGGDALDKLVNAGVKWRKTLEASGGSMGSAIEGAGRYTLYKDLRTKFVKQGMPVDEARKKASKVVSDTFFNYGELTHFERSFAKRLIPFYSFYSKNLPYWINSGLDPKKAAKLWRKEKLYNAIAEKPTERDQLGMPKYQKENNARIVSRGKDGKEIIYTPTTSDYDAWKMLNLSSMWDQMVEKFSPPIKAIGEIAFDKDLFLDQPLKPSSRYDGQRPLFSSGHKYAPLNLIPGVEPTYLSSKGSPMTDSDGLALFDKVANSYQFPIIGNPISGQIAGNIGNIATGRKSPWQTLIENFTPAKTTLLTPEQEGVNIRYRKKSSAKERKKKARDEKRRRDRRK